MENEGKIVELLAEMLVRQDDLLDELRNVKNEVSSVKKEVSSLKTEVIKLNLQTLKMQERY